MAAFGDSCAPRVSRYLRIEGFELNGGEERVVAGDAAACIAACTPDPVPFHLPS